MEVNGRQVEPIREDHLNRYEWASRRVRPSDLVLDVACGTGYGTYMLGDRAALALGYDVSHEAIQYANAHYLTASTGFMCADLNNVSFTNASLAVSFETIEHLEDPIPFLKETRKKAKHLMASVPNQSMLPFDPQRHKYHFRHYTCDQFQELLASVGWSVTSIHGQTGKQGHVWDLPRGATTHEGTTIIVCAE